MACDICGNKKDNLEPLTEMYQTESIRQICPDCVKEVNDKLWSIREMQRKMLSHLMKRFMRFKRRFAKK